MGERLAGMARQLRIEYPGAICHVMARGERIAHEESDRYSLIETLGEACVKTGRLMHAWDIDGQFAARRYDKGAANVSQQLGRERKLERASLK